MAQPRIGYIDARAEDRERLVKFLQLQQMTPFPMTSVAEAAEARQSVDFDLLVYAVRHQDQTPLELVCDLRKISYIPLILICDFQSPIDRIIALEAGCDEVVLVPYDAKELVARMRALIRRSKSPH